MSLSEISVQPDLPPVPRLAAAGQKYFVNHRGRAVCWRRFGDGPPLVLVHGGHGTWLHWIRNIDALARRHTLWIPDLPGYGESDSLDGDPLAPDRLDRLIEAAVATLDELVGRGTSIDIAGFSFGAMIASLMAVQRGDIGRMALLGAARPADATRSFREMKNWRVPDRQERHAALRHNLRALMLHRAWEHDELALAVHEAACAHGRFRTVGVATNADLKALVDRIGRPLMLVWGEHDVTAVPHEAGPWLAEGRQDVEWRVVPDAGHWVQFEAAAAVDEILVGWFGRGTAGKH